jgi:hypothetical protein
VAENASNRIQKFDSSGNWRRTWGKDVDTAPGTGFEICIVASNCQSGTAGGLGGEFDEPVGVGTDAAGAVYVGDDDNNRVQRFADPPAPSPPSPPPDGEDTAAKADRTLTLDANKNKVKKGKRVTLTGQVNQVTRQGACESGQPVQLQRKKPSQTTFTTVEQLQTSATGGFSTKEKVKKTYEYRAEVAETAACGGGLSNTEKVKVKKKK